ncbi:unnamed protein product [Cuscuta campestris]|uniref:Uncharacterized protein n=1 Tax=Cuscuta campestris TaxID=132261 RepID=A0A484L4P6_9ASTE|nr:unnamed protein product [Cuscuta campestris]
MQSKLASGGLTKEQSDAFLILYKVLLIIQSNGGSCTSDSFDFPSTSPAIVVVLRLDSLRFVHEVEYTFRLFKYHPPYK